MKRLFFKAGLVIALTTTSFGTFAETLNLNDLKKEVLEGGIDAKIQYEKYYQAQKNINVALGDFLPRLNANIFFFNTTYGILQGVVPTPSNWYKYKASKDLAKAEKYNSETVRLNILDGLTKNYIQVKKNQAVLNSLKEELALLENYRAQTEALYALGDGDAAEYHTAVRQVSRTTQDILLIQSLNNKLKESIMIALNRDPSQSLTLAALPEITYNIPETLEEARLLALENSSENKTNFYLYQAALDLTRSARWSFISFEGIGFGYPSALAIEKSKARVIKLRIEQTDNQISNQVYTAYNDLEIIEQRIETQKQIIALVAEETALNNDLHVNGVLSTKDNVNSQLALLREQRSLQALKTELRIKLTSIQRLLSTESTLEPVDVSAVESGEFQAHIVKARKKSTKYVLKYALEEEIKSQVYGIFYQAEGKKGLMVKKASKDYPYYVTTKKNVETLVKVTIKLINGKEVNKTVVLGSDQ